MIKKIFKSAKLLILSIIIAFSTMFSAINPAGASQMGADSSQDNSMGIVIEESVDSLDDTKTNSVPDLGDDQAFPFIPGFGKNSGKD